MQLGQKHILRAYVNLPCQWISGVVRWCRNEDDLVSVDVTKSQVTKAGTLIDLVDISIRCIVRHIDYKQAGPCWNVGEETVRETPDYEFDCNRKLDSTR